MLKEVARLLDIDQIPIYTLHQNILGNILYNLWKLGIHLDCNKILLFGNCLLNLSNVDKVGGVPFLPFEGWKP